MPKRLEAIKTHAVSLCGKFNSVLEEQLLNGRDNLHKIMSIEVRPDEFDLQGNLNSSGKASFWREVDRAMKKFVQGDIKLLPRKFTQAHAAPGRHAHNAECMLCNVAEVHRCFTEQQPASQRRLWSPDARRLNSQSRKCSHSRSRYN